MVAVAGEVVEEDVGDDDRGSIPGSGANEMRWHMSPTADKSDIAGFLVLCTTFEIPAEPKRWLWHCMVVAWYGRHRMTKRYKGLQR